MAKHLVEVLAVCSKHTEACLFAPSRNRRPSPVHYWVLTCWDLTEFRTMGFGRVMLIIFTALKK